MALRYTEMFVIVMVTYFNTGFCEESNEETKVGVEYMQIFRNIPTLFEYFLDVLEQRVEILEKDDISVFQTGNDRGKRQIEITSEDQCYTNDGLDEEDYNKVTKWKKCNTGNRYKRENNRASEYTTEVHEYGRSRGQKSKPANDLSENTESDKKLAKRDIIPGRRPNLSDVFAKTNQITQPNINKDPKTNSKVVKRNIADFGKAFAGFDWSLFFLTPDEVADKAIETEQIIEEHNDKHRKKT